MNDLHPGKSKNYVVSVQKKVNNVKVRVEKATWKQTAHLLCQGKQRNDYTVKECKNLTTNYSPVVVVIT